jgi:hypothetical protein
VQIVDACQKNVKKVDQLMSVQDVVVSNVAVGMLLMINPDATNYIIIINNSI